MIRHGYRSKFRDDFMEKIGIMRFLPLDKSRILHYNIDNNRFALNLFKIVSGEVWVLFIA